MVTSLLVFILLAWAGSLSLTWVYASCELRLCQSSRSQLLDLTGSNLRFQIPYSSARKPNSSLVSEPCFKFRSVESQVNVLFWNCMAPLKGLFTALELSPNYYCLSSLKLYCCYHIIFFFLKSFISPIIWESSLMSRPIPFIKFI